MYGGDHGGHDHDPAHHHDDHATGQRQPGAEHTATASGQADVYGPGNAVDGNANSYWESANNAFPQWITVDFGAPVSVSRVVLKLPPSSAWGARTQTLSILGSTDGGAYSTLAASRGYAFDPASGNTATATFGAATAVPAVQVTGEHRVARRSAVRTRGLQLLSTVLPLAAHTKERWPCSAMPENSRQTRKRPLAAAAAVAIAASGLTVLGSVIAAPTARQRVDPAGERAVHRVRGGEPATNGQTIGPDYTQARCLGGVGSQAVTLNGGQYVEFTLSAAANSINVHYNRPTARSGRLAVYVKGSQKVGDLRVTSQYSYIDTGWIPGAKNHKFYDDARACCSARTWRPAPRSGCRSTTRRRRPGDHRPRRLRAGRRAATRSRRTRCR